VQGYAPVAFRIFPAQPRKETSLLDVFRRAWTAKRLGAIDC
jgi:hypothetical protein